MMKMRPSRKSEAVTSGMVHLYYGDGKGKTTAALGLLIRAFGAGKSCLFVQFLKGSPTSELETLRRLEIPYLRTDEVKKFVVSMTEEEREACTASHALCFDRLLSAVAAHSPDCVVLDEVLDAVSLGMLPEEQVLQFLRECRGKTEVILTGHNPIKRFLEVADYVTEMKNVCHPYSRGISARKGIEY